MGYKILFKFGVIQGMHYDTYHGSGVQSPVSHWEGSVLIPDQIKCDFLWAK
jgi:hypothetical protein